MKIAVWGKELTAWVTAGALAKTGNDISFVSDSHIDETVRLLNRINPKYIGALTLTLNDEEAPNGNDSSIHWDLVQIQRADYGGGEILVISPEGELLKKVTLPPNPPPT